MQLSTKMSHFFFRAAAGMAAILAITLAACGGSASSSQTVPGVTSSTITIGTVLDTTGPLKTICTPIYQGDQLYINQINAAGGINGRKINLVQVSDNGDSTQTKDAVRQLFEQDNAFALFQVCGSGDANVAETYTNPKGIPFVDPIGGGAAYTDSNGNALPWVWMAQPNYGDEGHVLGYYITQTLKAKTVALLYENDVLGLQQKQTLSEEMQKYGGSVVASVGYNYTQTDFTSAVQTLKAANPDMIVLNGLPIPTGTFVKTATAQGYKPPMGYIANYPMADNSWPAFIGPAAQGIYVSGYTSINTAVGQKYLQLTSTDTVFSAYKFYGYIMTKLFVDALQKTGSNLTRATLQQTLNTQFTNYDTGFGPTISWSATNHGGISDFMIYQVQNGTLNPVSSFIQASQVWP